MDGRVGEVELFSFIRESDHEDDDSQYRNMSGAGMDEDGMEEDDDIFNIEDIPFGPNIFNADENVSTTTVEVYIASGDK